MLLLFQARYVYPGSLWKQTNKKKQINKKQRNQKIPIKLNSPPWKAVMSPAAAALVEAVSIEVHMWELAASGHLWLLNVCFAGPEVGSDLSDAQLLDRAKLVCFCAVGGPLPLPAKPLSDCQAVKQPPITGGNSGFKVPVYSAHAATLQRLVITICSGFLHSSPLGSHSFFLLVVFRLSVRPSPIYRIYFPSIHFPSFLLWHCLSFHQSSHYLNSPLL